MHIPVYMLHQILNAVQAFLLEIQKKKLHTHIKEHQLTVFPTIDGTEAREPTFKTNQKKNKKRK